MPSVLFVFISASKTLTGKPTGWYLPEAAHPYYILSPHVQIDFAAPAGANPPIDEYSVKSYTDDGSVKFLNDETVEQKLANAKKLVNIDYKEYDAVFYVGGHGPAIDLASDAVNARLVSDFWKSGKIVAAVCHGPAALVQGVDEHGQSIFKGKKFTVLSNDEEVAINGVNEIPFSPEDKIIELGGIFEKADELFEAKTVVDGKLVTGQNPASSAGVGEAILKLIKGDQRLRE
ncbi:ThiJ/PfpI domain-containing protein [Coprinopsis cinerea okayama7|uniref:D-lactate dehydratase n=1 Tax=Coprinopsis cinerea (strain Okayama-7 / 130 / ATCC MYA-4618 / FGSC 9003) TaxID=240176 RepID=A8NRJ4_COPC7|nr:ThiJ/PfpI domain-containing protein [Coprinopsis cinerea okayama7\|eukprot:XP_001835797.2 ThiJ/PfpI domain-containing protein [Coprinopsis cinerea okayama7\